MLDPKNNAMLAEPSLIANRILFLEAKGYFQQVNIFLNHSFEMNVHFGAPELSIRILAYQGYHRSRKVTKEVIMIFTKQRNMKNMTFQISSVD